MAGLELLIRLARRALDEEQRALRELDDAIAEVQSELLDLARELEAERHALASAEATQLTLAAYLASRRERRAALTARLAEVEARHGEQLTRLTERRLELRRLELLEQRARRRLAAAERRREQAEIDELARARFARRRSGAADH